MTVRTRPNLNRRFDKNGSSKRSKSSKGNSQIFRKENDHETVIAIRQGNMKRLTLRDFLLMPPQKVEPKTTRKVIDTDPDAVAMVLVRASQQPEQKKPHQRWTVPARPLCPADQRIPGR